MSRAAIAGDIAGSRFEWSLWEGASLADTAFVGYESDSPFMGARGENALSFDLFHDDSHPTDDSVLMIAVMDWLLEGGDPRTFLRRRFRAIAVAIIGVKPVWSIVVNNNLGRRARRLELIA